MMRYLFPVIPILYYLVWLGLVVYLVILGTRLVNAVELIARSLAQRPEKPPL